MIGKPQGYTSFLYAYTIIVCTLFLGLIVDDTHPSVRGWGNLYLDNNKSILSTNGLQHKVDTGDSITVVSPCRSNKIKQIEVTGDVDERNTYNKKTWILQSVQVICGHCDYNKTIDRGDPVYIIYPKVDSVRHIENNGRRLPEGFSRETIDLALDVSGNKKEDILVVEYCRGNPTISPDSMARQNCREALKAFRFQDGEYKVTFESPTPPPLDH